MNIIQVGIVAYRDPKTKEFETAKPLYQPETPELLRQQELLQHAFKDIAKANLQEFLCLKNKAAGQKR